MKSCQCRIFLPVPIWQYPVIPIQWVPSGWLCPNQRTHSGVNVAAAEQRGRVWGAEPGSQTRPRPGGFEAPHPSPQTGGLGQPARAGEREKVLYQQARVQLWCAVWELGELTLCIDEWMNRRRRAETLASPPPHSPPTPSIPCWISVCFRSAISGPQGPSPWTDTINYQGQPLATIWPVAV